jgi:hypothetical protein
MSSNLPPGVCVFAAEDLAALCDFFINNSYTIRWSESDYVEQSFMYKECKCCYESNFDSRGVSEIPHKENCVGVLVAKIRAAAVTKGGKNENY